MLVSHVCLIVKIVRNAAVNRKQVKLFPHRRRNTDGGRGGAATGSSPHSAIPLRRGSDGGAAACPSRLPPPAGPSLLVDPVLAEAMAGVIAGMQK